MRPWFALLVTACAAAHAAPPPRDRSIASSDDHTCALAADGVVCWGDNTGAESGDRVVAHATPVKIPFVGGDDLVQVTVAFRSGCVLHRAGTLACWTRGRADVVPSFNSPVVELAATGGSICGLLANGALDCQFLDRGDPLRGREITPTWRPFGWTVSGASRIVASGDHFCAIAHGRVTCSSRDIRVPPKIDDAVEISLSYEASCLVRASGKVVCSDGQPPAPAIDDAVDVALGKGHVCALRRGGSVACWGDNYAGNYQASTSDPRADPVRQVSGMTDAVAVTAGRSFSCARRRSGEVACWGSTSAGRLGNGAMLEHETPVRITALAGATQLAVGENFTCAADAAGEIRCVGALAFNCFHPGQKRHPASPRAIGRVPKGGTILALKYQICALAPSGDLTCWNDESGSRVRALHARRVPSSQQLDYEVAAMILDNGDVALSHAPFGEDRPPFVIADLHGAVDVANQTGSTCAVRRGGTVSCFGYDWSYENNGVRASTRIVDLPGVSDAASIVAGTGWYCEREASGGVTCFMMDRAGAFSGVEHLGVPPVAAMAGGFDRATLLLRDGRIQSVARRWPAAAVEVSGVKDVVAIGSGQEHACALDQRGDVWCWGTNLCGAIEPQPGVELDPVPVAIRP